MSAYWDSLALLNAIVSQSVAARMVPSASIAARQLIICGISSLDARRLKKLNSNL